MRLCSIMIVLYVFKVTYFIFKRTLVEFLYVPVERPRLSRRETQSLDLTPMIEFLQPFQNETSGPKIMMLNG